MSESAPSSTKNSSWYHQSFGDLYAIVYAHRSSEAAQKEIRALLKWVALEPGCRVLDACCGNGRHLQALVQSGYKASGFDLSNELITQASDLQTLKGRVCRGDIRQIPFSGTFDVVLNLFTSFGYFEDDADNRLAFNQLMQCVKTGGIMILDHINAARTCRTLIRESVSIQRGLQIKQQRWIRAKRVQKRIEITNSLGDQKVFREDVRMYDPDEMIEMAQSAGLIDISLHGSFLGEPFNDDSERMILRGRRPVAGI